MANLSCVSTRPTFRRALRAGALAVPVAALLSASPASASPPESWGTPAPMSALTALLVFGGIPLLIIGVITLLVLAPSITRGDRQQRGVASWTEPQWFGGPGEALTASDRSGREIEGGVPVRTGGAKAPEQSGGASARW